MGRFSGTEWEGAFLARLPQARAHIGVVERVSADGLVTAKNTQGGEQYLPGDPRRGANP